MNIAVHAVKPLCPHCGHHVRSSVELQADLVDLNVDVARTLRDAGLRRFTSLEAAADYDSALAVVRVRFQGLEAELRGEHRVCGMALH